jgi:hypothetical protein
VLHGFSSPQQATYLPSCCWLARQHGPLFGAPSVKEVRLDMSDWRDLRELMLPMQ